MSIAKDGGPFYFGIFIELKSGDWGGWKEKIQAAPPYGLARTLGRIETPGLVWKGADIEGIYLQE